MMVGALGLQNTLGFGLGGLEEGSILKILNAKKRRLLFPPVVGLRSCLSEQPASRVGWLAGDVGWESCVGRLPSPFSQLTEACWSWNAISPCSFLPLFEVTALATTSCQKQGTQPSCFAGTCFYCGISVTLWINCSQQSCRHLVRLRLCHKANMCVCFRALDWAHRTLL